MAAVVGGTVFVCVWTDGITVDIPDDSFNGTLVGLVVVDAGTIGLVVPAITVDGLIEGDFTDGFNVEEVVIGLVVAAGIDGTVDG